MKSTIYRQAYPNPYHECIEVPDEPPEYILIPCRACDSGIFYITDFTNVIN